MSTLMYRIRSLCCPRAASGHETAAPPSSVTPPQYRVRPYARFVRVKSAEQQGQLDRKALITWVRCRISRSRGREGTKALLAIIADDGDERVPVDARASLIVLAAQLQALQTLVGSIEKRIIAQHRASEASRRLASVTSISSSAPHSGMSDLLRPNAIATQVFAVAAQNVQLVVIVQHVSVTFLNKTMGASSLVQ